MTLAIIALASVAMVACSGQPKQKTGACGEPCCQPKVECSECPSKVDCPKKAECTKKAECPEAKCAECPKKAECTTKSECPKKAECSEAKCQQAK